MKGLGAFLASRLRERQAGLERAVLRGLLALAWRRRGGMGLWPARPRSILVLRPDEIGDMVLAVPLLRALRRRHPGARISLAAQAAPGALARALGLADEVIPMGGGRDLWPVLGPAWRAWRCGRRLKGRRFDWVLYPRRGGDFRQAGLLAALVSAPFKATFAVEGSAEGALWECLPPGVWDLRVVGRGRHEAEHLAAFGAALGLGDPGPGARRLTDPALRRAAARMLPGPGPWLAVAPFARSGRRLWPLDRWAALASRLAAARGLRPFVLAGPGEAPAARALGRSLGASTPVYAPADLRQAAALLSRARLFMGADSAAAHMAAAEGRPCLVVSCHPLGAPEGHANAPERFGPWGVPALVLRPPAHAWPCVEGCASHRPHCILGVAPDRACAAALQWSKRSRGHPKG